jgi:hypothetical protein
MSEAVAQPAPAADVKAKEATKAAKVEPLVDKVHTWPYLVRLEMIVATFFMVFMTIWSIFIDAPLEEPANPTRTPNPSKAPWYFLGLQEMLVYFDPWFAGVVLPSIIIVGLMVIPYIDINPKGNGYYCFRDRWFAITNYLFGFLILWVLLIIIGTFLRGPGWYFFAPWTFWDVHKTVAITNINLSNLLARWTHVRWFNTEMGGYAVGLAAVGGFLGAPFPWFFKNKKKSETLQKLGFVRFAIVSQLFMLMMLLPFKMVLRWTLNIKYLLVTPWFNI